MKEFSLATYKKMLLSNLEKPGSINYSNAVLNNVALRTEEFFLRLLKDISEKLKNNRIEKVSYLGDPRFEHTIFLPGYIERIDMPNDKKGNETIDYLIGHRHKGAWISQYLLETALVNNMETEYEHHSCWPQSIVSFITLAKKEDFTELIAKYSKDLWLYENRIAVNKKFTKLQNEFTIKSKSGGQNHDKSG